MTTELTILTDDYLNHMYRVSYEELRHLCGSLSPVVEVGSGSCVSRFVAPSWVRSDVIFASSLSIQAGATSLPFASESVGAIVMRDTWHHISDLTQFLDECDRVLQPGGKVIISDPYWGLLARLVYKYLHHEEYDDHVAGWSFTATSPWSSNQALAYIVLRRDRSLFSEKWPRLAIVEHGARVGPSFLLSGGVSRRTSIPGLLLRNLFILESRLGTWFNPFRFFFVFEIQKLIN
jgi:SAM-dependent methyltransferase